MCNGVCTRFTKALGLNYYCQGCAKFVGKKFLKREPKNNGRLRCSCCNGLVRNKARFRGLHGFITSKKPTAH